MSGREVEDSRDAGGSADKSDYLESTSSPTSPGDENSDSPAPQYAQDLKSVLVTSVLNLEELDVDLYR